MFGSWEISQADEEAVNNLLPSIKDKEFYYKIKLKTDVKELY